MQKINPGIGYNFSSNRSGFTLDIPSAFQAVTPFQVSVSGTKIYVYPGTLNNCIPVIGGTGLSNLLTHTQPQPSLNYSPSTNNIYVYLECGPLSSGSNSFPNTTVGNYGYPKITSYSTIKTNTENTAYILIATITDKGGNIFQHITYNIMGERHIFTEPNSFSYYFWRL
jgi:hypothetical protein